VSLVHQLIDIAGLLVVIYLFIYCSFQLAFVVIGFRQVRRKLRGQAFEDLDIVFDSPLTAPLSIVVPAYNEEKTIVESLASLARLRFPRLEIIVVNDGSKDETLSRIIEAYGFRRMEITYDDHITTRPIRGFYEKRDGLPPGIVRWVLIDKANGGKADALNAGINASTCPLFVSVDADSILDEDALLKSFRVMLRDERVVAIGGQVGIVNGCTVSDGRVQTLGLPRSWLARLQLVEYLRSFTLGRTALDALDSNLIISGVFGIFRKDIVVRVGGYLTRSTTRRLLHEYVGAGRDTVCEDMEIVVRIQRYIKDKRLPLRVAYTPQPLCWTEVPENLGSLTKQRNRWMRGLIETLVYHRALMGERRQGVIGWFGFPYFLLFECLSAPIEFCGYLVLPLFWSVGLLSPAYLLWFLFISIAYGMLVSVSAVAASTWLERTDASRQRYGSLLGYAKGGEILALIACALVENLGYRQLTLWMRVRGLWDWWRGATGWEKFERKGFDRAQAPAPQTPR
jgi:cellulose synthase/poly-beta-1,6-N-acetylglucosamine synthase-like glycosyltransferase